MQDSQQNNADDHKNKDQLVEIKKKRRRGVYLIPNLFTTLGLFAGFYAIIQAINGEYANAAIAIFAAMLLDGVDGRVARMTNTQTDFGAEYDSLADMVSFGIAPALVIYEWSLKVKLDVNPHMAKIGGLIAFFYVAMAALRLARFNVQIDTLDKRYFRGLPSPAAAGLVMSYIWLCVELNKSGSEMLYYSLVVTVAAGSLMISPILFNSFKGSSKEGKIPFRGAALIVMVLILIKLYPPQVLFLVFFLYASSGPMLSLLRRVRRRKKHSLDS